MGAFGLGLVMATGLVSGLGDAVRGWREPSPPVRRGFSSGSCGIRERQKSGLGKLTPVSGGSGVASVGEEAPYMGDVGSERFIGSDKLGGSIGGELFIATAGQGDSEQSEADW